MTTQVTAGLCIHSEAAGQEPSLPSHPLPSLPCPLPPPSAPCPVPRPHPLPLALCPYPLPPALCPLPLPSAPGPLPIAPCPRPPPPALCPPYRILHEELQAQLLQAPVQIRRDLPVLPPAILQALGGERAPSGRGGGGWGGVPLLMVRGRNCVSPTVGGSFRLQRGSSPSLASGPHGGPLGAQVPGPGSAPGARPGATSGQWRQSGPEGGSGGPSQWVEPCGPWRIQGGSVLLQVGSCPGERKGLPSYPPSCLLSSQRMDPHNPPSSPPLSHAPPWRTPAPVPVTPPPTAHGTPQLLMAWPWGAGSVSGHGRAHTAGMACSLLRRPATRGRSSCFWAAGWQASWETPGRPPAVLGTVSPVLCPTGPTRPGHV